MKKKKKKKTKKVKRQFSKLHVLFANALVFYVYTMSAILSFLDKMPISDIAIAVITVYGAFATGGYFALAGFRDLSLNKHGISFDEKTGEKYYMPDPNLNHIENFDEGTV